MIAYRLAYCSRISGMTFLLVSEATSAGLGLDFDELPEGILHEIGWRSGQEDGVRSDWSRRQTDRCGMGRRKQCVLRGFSLLYTWRGP